MELPYIRSLENRADGKLILVTAITPTPAGEGKTTTTVGLSDGLNRIGKKAVACLREPSLGPCFGMKGGAAGGGYAQVVPMTDINLHFTGDFHAITSANNLLAALVDNHIYWGNALGLDPRRVSWRRALDMNDRALRQIVSSLGGVSNGYPREDGFDITVASEVMAIVCLSRDLEDLQRRLANIIVGTTRERKAVRAADLDAAGAMAALLRDALAPNLVQTLEHNPAFIHGGPFANIAHGCNSVIATRTALKLADYVVTEAGFGADLGAEKFFDIKCRKAGLAPSAAVLVATIRALKMHGGVAKEALKREDADAVQRGFANLERHVRNLRKFGVPPVVAVNRFSADTEVEMDRLRTLCEGLGVRCVVADHWAHGGAGAEDLARAVVEQVETAPAQFRPLYPRRHDAVGQAAHDRHRDLRCRRGDGRSWRSEALRRAAGGRLRPPAGLRGENPVQLQHRSEEGGCAQRSRAARAGREAVCRRRVHRRRLRRDHDDARAAESAGSQQHLPLAGRTNYRVVLSSLTGCFDVTSGHDRSRRAPRALKAYGRTR